jgi:hypothetical protein
MCQTEKKLVPTAPGIESQVTPPNPASTADEWVCEVCTLRNKGQCLRCLVCYSPRRCTDPGMTNSREIEMTLQTQRNLLKMRQSGTLTEASYSRLVDGLLTRTVTPAFDLPNGVRETASKQWYNWDTKQWMQETIEVIIEWSPPLGEGNIRVALRMLDLSRPAGQRACVAKYIKEKWWDEKHGKQQGYVDVEMQAHCRAVAAAFNKANPPKRVEFLDAWTITRSKPDLPPNMQILAGEPYLDVTRYQKHNSNFGFVHPTNRNTPQAFSHFSWEYSKRRFIIVDIQGVGDVYTDPQMHSADDDGSGNGPWGIGNLGKKGIDRFLETHRCNAVCRALGLEPTRQPISLGGTQADCSRPVEPLEWRNGFRVSNYIRGIRPIPIKPGSPHNVTQEDLSLLKIDEEEFNAIVGVFNTMDADHNGALAIDEVVAMLNVMGDFEFSPQNTLYLLELARDQEISFNRFLLWYKGIE